MQDNTCWGDMLLWYAMSLSGAHGQLKPLGGLRGAWRTSRVIRGSHQGASLLAFRNFGRAPCKGSAIKCGTGESSWLVRRGRVLRVCSMLFAGSFKENPRKTIHFGGRVWRQTPDVLKQVQWSDGRGFLLSLL